MQIAYLDCTAGVSGSRMLAALVDAGVDVRSLEEGAAAAGLGGCRFSALPTSRGGVRALEVALAWTDRGASLTAEGRGDVRLGDVEAFLTQSALAPRQQKFCLAVVQKLFYAEAKTQGVEPADHLIPSDVARDALAHAVGVAVACDALGIERLLSSPIAVGTGCVEWDGRRWSVPAPAVAELLIGAPLSSSTVAAELTTPLGAALLMTRVDAFGPLPSMTLQRMGHGADAVGSELTAPLRLFVGAAPGIAQGVAHGAAEGEMTNSWSFPPQTDAIVLLETNLDDMTGEGLGHCQRLLREAGALDVATASLQMKKGRPGTWLLVQCRPQDADRLAAIVFCETSALGVRRSMVERIVLPRRVHTVATPWGPVVGVAAQLPDGRERFSPEYEGCAATAAAHGVAWDQVYQSAQAAFLQSTRAGEESCSTRE